ncbi:MAG: hypothetical protein WCJ30_22635 [Deltaproteobacteria bacterium]
MATLKRKSRVVTFSVSVAPETRERLRRAARRAYGGNVSALIEAIALEADRQDALDWLLARAPAPDEAEYAAFLHEMVGPKRKRSRSAA